MHSKIRTDSKEEAERVGKYMIIPILSLLRIFTLMSLREKFLTNMEKADKKRSHMDYLEFVARVTSNIPYKV